MGVRIAFLGDTLLGGAAQRTLDRHGYDHALSAIGPLWADADLLVVNHEGAVTRRTDPAPKHEREAPRYWYRADPRAVHALARSGVAVVSLANNHVGDFGADGVLDTMSAFDAAGIVHCGAGETDTAARRAAVVEVGGLRVGFLSVMQRYEMYVAEDVYAHRGNPGPARLRMSRLGPDIAELRARVDLCVVLVHWGRNYRPVTDLQERLAAEIAAAGPDLVVGHHPHVAQPVARVQGVPVLYSLGNGAFGTRGRFADGVAPYGLVAVVDAEPHRVTGLDLRPIHVDNTVVHFRPRPGQGAGARAFVASLQPPGAEWAGLRPVAERVRSHV